MSGSPMEFVGRGYDAAVELGDVTLVAVAGGVHRLNPSAALVWNLWAEPATPGAIADALADELGTIPRTFTPDVIDAMEGLLAAGLLAPVAGMGHDRMVLEPVPACSGCGPGPSYERHVLVAVGDAAVTIGADVELADALAIGFGAATLDVLPAVGRASYGVVVPDAGPGPQHELSRLHRGPDALARAGDPLRIIRALVDQVGAHAAPERVIVLEGVAVVVAGVARVMPLPGQRSRFERRWRAQGGRASDGAVVAVDIDARTVVVGAPWLGFAETAVNVPLDARRWRDESDAVPAGGEYPLAGFEVSAAPGFGRVVGELGPSVSFARIDAASVLLDLVDAVGVTGPTGPDR